MIRYELFDNGELRVQEWPVEGGSSRLIDEDRTEALCNIVRRAYDELSPHQIEVLHLVDKD